MGFQEFLNSKNGAVLIRYPPYRQSRVLTAASDSAGSLIAKSTQLLHARFREVLVALANLLGGVNELDVLFLPEGGKDRTGEVEERARLAGAEVDDAALDGLLEGEVKNIDDVIHEYEVAFLMAMLDAFSVAAKEAHTTALGDLVVGVERDARHLGLVTFTETVDVEELERGPA